MCTIFTGKIQLVKLGLPKSAARSKEELSDCYSVLTRLPMPINKQFHYAVMALGMDW